MANTFDDLKKSRANNLSNISQELDKLKTKNYDNNDERFWQPTADKNKTGQATIRFLDSPKGEDAPFVRIFEYSWQGPGGWFINKCPSTIGKPSPVYDEFKSLWKEDKERAKKEAPKRQTKFISNILVISDPKNPDAEGKVWLFKYGPAIFDKLNEKWNPEFEGMEKTNPCDLWEGQDFKLRFKHKDGYRNYDASSFDDEVSAIADDDAEIAKIWKSEYSLEPFLDPSNFKSYEDLQKELHRAMGVEEEQPLFMRDTEPQKSKRTPRKLEEDEEVIITPKKSSKKVLADDSDDTEEFLKRIKALAQEDDDQIPF